MRRRFSLQILPLTALLLLAGCAQPKRGILLMAHGGDAEWNQQVESIVAPLRQQYPLEVAFGMATTSTIQEAVRRLEAQDVREIAVVRMFVSDESFLLPTEYILGLRSDLPPDPHGNYLPPRSSPTCHSDDSHAKETSLRVAADTTAHDRANTKGSNEEHHCMEPPERVPTKARILLSREGVADSPLVEQILVDRVKALSRDPSREAILILGHGPGDDQENQRWLEKMGARTRAVDQVGRFREVRCETLREDWPERRRDAERRIREFVRRHSQDGDRVIVVPFRIAGFGPYREVLQGLEYVASPHGFCPHPNMTQWIARTAASCFAQR